MPALARPSSIVLLPASVLAAVVVAALGVTQVRAEPVLPTTAECASHFPDCRLAPLQQAAIGTPAVGCGESGPTSEAIRPESPVRAVSKTRADELQGRDTPVGNPGASRTAADGVAVGPARRSAAGPRLHVLFCTWLT
jgi:hypothetical protein